MPEEVFETSQTTPPLEPKSFDRPKIILVAVLGLGLLAAAAYAGYWYGTESAKLETQSAKPQPKTQIQQTPTPTLDSTANWQIYTNTKHNYLLKYPPELTVAEDPHADSPSVQTWDAVSFSGFEFDLIVRVNPTDAHGNLIVCSTNEECKSKILAFLQKTLSETTPFSATVFGETRTGFKYEIPSTLYDTYAHFLVFLENGKLWEIGVYWGIGVYNRDSSPDYDLINQILSTFKFL